MATLLFLQLKYRYGHRSRFKLNDKFLISQSNIWSRALVQLKFLSYVTIYTQNDIYTRDGSDIRICRCSAFFWHPHPRFKCGCLYLVFSEFFELTLKYYNIFFIFFIKMIFIKHQYNYSQTFDYKQITEKTAQNVLILWYM